MPANGRESWATRNLAVPGGVKDRLRAVEAYPKEPFWRIIKRLLDEHDSRAPASPSQPSEKQPFFSRVFGGESKAEIQRRETAASDETSRAAALAEVPS